jgi:hypothetical protein
VKIARPLRISRDMARTRFGLMFDAFIREFAERFFRVISWTVYMSVLVTIYIKTGNLLVWSLCFFGYVVMFLFINSYMRDLSDAIVGRLGIENRPMLFVPILLISGLITYGIIRLSTTVAVEIATYGK